jgi:beta-galactosidase
VRWYRSTARLDLPRGQDTPLALELAERADGKGKDYRAQIFVNGWLIGRHLADTGPQSRFVIPSGLLQEHGTNTVALAVWSTHDGSGPASARLVDLGASAGGIPVQAVRAPSYDAKTYAKAPTGAEVTVAGEPFLRAGGTGRATVSFHVPEKAARDVDLSLKTPDGWTAKADDPTHFARVAPGATVTARYTVTAPADPVPYALLSATASYRQDGRTATTTGERAVQVPPPAPAGDVYVSDLPLVRAVNGWGPVERDTSNGENAAGDGHTLSIGGTTYAKGLGGHADSYVRVHLGGVCTRFTATVGVDDEVGDNGSVSFKVTADGRDLFTSPTLRGTDPGTPVDVDVTGARWLDLTVDGGGDVSTDHADWAAARLSCGGGA